MAFISIQPRDFFSTVLYTGTQATGNAITGVGFQPDLIWCKNRELTVSNIVFDAARGTTKYIYTNSNSAQGTDANSLESFDSDGFTVGSWDVPNYLNDGYTSFNWKAGTTTGLSGGTITPSAYSINPSSGFGIYQYTGNATSGATIAHGLGTAPEVVWCKKISGAGSWSCGWKGGPLTFTKYLTLDTDEEAFASSGYWNNTAPDATNIYLGNGHTNSSGVDQIMYAWAPVKGFSHMGVYEGNNDSDGPFI